MANIVEGKPWFAKIQAIKPAYELGGDGSDPIAIVKWRQQIKGDRRTRTGWFPLEKGQILLAGEEVSVNPITEYIEKGSLTIYKLQGIARLYTPGISGESSGAAKE